MASPPRLFVEHRLPGAGAVLALVLFDGSGGQWSAEVLAMERRGVQVRLREHDAREAELPIAVTLALAMPANDRMDALVEKATELGVAAIVPLLPEHRIDMRSKPGEGTRFSIDLPYAETAGLEGRSDPVLPPEAADLAGLYILYVEDDRLVRESALRLFETLNMRYEAFASLAELELALPDFERDPDVLITDYRLPDGRTAEDIVVATSGAFEARLPLVVITGEMQSFDAGWLNGGRVLRKPVSPEALVLAISAVTQAPAEA